jgi:hypothetical protein
MQGKEEDGNYQQLHLLNLKEIHTKIQQVSSKARSFFGLSSSDFS